MKPYDVRTHYRAITDYLVHGTPHTQRRKKYVTFIEIKRLYYYMHKKTEATGTALVELVWEKSWTYIKTVVDVVREPILILNKDLEVMAANEPFYRAFHVEAQNTEGKKVYDLGNGQWDIPELRKLLENILPQHSVFKGFEVSHNFPSIGPKIMILNARQIHFNEDATLNNVPPIILLAIEDISDMMNVAETLAGHARHFEAKLTERTEKLELQIKNLQKEVRSRRKF